ncbi:toprim domain-containing protein [Porphyromonas gulae]|uniref:Mobilization protein n=1 Tax=Porphyromonas gulae TaxID=111105 RepID=A0A0A2F6A1_9PORP|nr:toprim domain-containing protein [Porphyromonas gulae]KGN85587.1 mobilization protein [Porphyromonas gulae]
MKPRYYDIQSIKQQPISAYLKSCGIVPAKEYTHYALYHAPYRNDHNASLKVDFRQNLWHDYGIGKGGSIIDLVMLMRECSAYEAMAHLSDEELSGQQKCETPAFHRSIPPHTGNSPSNTRRILSISEELPLHLKNYLQEVRKIDLAIASPYLRHIRYTVGGREYATIGFPNRSGGYELRDNRNFKGSIAPKDISLINGETGGMPCLFEGFIDFLSLLTMKGKETDPCLILNSVSNLHKAVAYLQEAKTCSVKVFFDNDEAGREAVRALRATGIEVEDMSRCLYPHHKDLNEYHVAQSKQQQEVQQVKPTIAKRRIR